MIITENLQFVHSEPNVQLADPLRLFCSIIYGCWAKVRKCTVGTSLETLSPLLSGATMTGITPSSTGFFFFNKIGFFVG